MSIHPDAIYNFAITGNIADVDDKLFQLVFYLLGVFDREKEQFAKQNNVKVEPEEFSELRESYAVYLAELLLGMRDRCLEKQQKLKDQGEFEKTLMFLFVMNQFKTIEDTEWSNSKQLAQLEVVKEVRLIRPNAKIEKRWVAHAGACDFCQAMNGVTIPLDEPFLRSGQIIESDSGEEFIYNYIDRDVAVLHPNDKCYIEFIITY